MDEAVGRVAGELLELVAIGRVDADAREGSEVAVLERGDIGHALGIEPGHGWAIVVVGRQADATAPLVQQHVPGLLPVPPQAGRARARARIGIEPSAHELATFEDSVAMGELDGEAIADANQPRADQCIVAREDEALDRAAVGLAFDERVHGLQPAPGFGPHRQGIDLRKARLPELGDRLGDRGRDMLNGPLRELRRRPVRRRQEGGTPDVGQHQPSRRVAAGP